MSAPTLADEMKAVVANLVARDWIQGEMRNGESVCAHGAVQTCQGLRPGDGHIIRAVMRTKGVTEGWNDESGRTKEQVVARMALIEVSDADLEETFGPAWRPVVAVIRRAALLTPTEAKELAAARAAAWDPAWDAARAAAWDPAWDAARAAAWDPAWDAARDAARAAARDAAWDAAWAAARAAAWDAARAAARDAAWDAAWAAARAAAWAAARAAAWDAARAAAWAASVSDLVGQHGLTQGYIDTLMGPWLQVLGADWAEGLV